MIKWGSVICLTCGEALCVDGECTIGTQDSQPQLLGEVGDISIRKTDHRFPPDDLYITGKICMA